MCPKNAFVNKQCMQSLRLSHVAENIILQFLKKFKKLIPIILHAQVCEV